MAVKREGDEFQGVASLLGLIAEVQAIASQLDASGVPRARAVEARNAPHAVRASSPLGGGPQVTAAGVEALALLQMLIGDWLAAHASSPLQSTARQTTDFYQTLSEHVQHLGHGLSRTYGGGEPPQVISEK